MAMGSIGVSNLPRMSATLTSAKIRPAMNQTARVATWRSSTDLTNVSIPRDYDLLTFQKTGTGPFKGGVRRLLQAARGM
jgi:hypothetical protein